MRWVITRKTPHPTNATTATFSAKIAKPTSAPRTPSAVASTMIEIGIARASTITTLNRFQSNLIGTPPVTNSGPLGHNALLRKRATDDSARAGDLLRQAWATMTKGVLTDFTDR